MKSKNIPSDIKSKSLNEAKLEISNILDRFEKQDVDLENSTQDYERLLLLSRHIENLFKDKLSKIRSIKKRTNNE